MFPEVDELPLATWRMHEDWWRYVDGVMARKLHGLSEYTIWRNAYEQGRRAARGEPWTDADLWLPDEDA